MAERIFMKDFGRRVALTLKVSDELWYNRLVNGERMYHLLNIGWLKMPRYPGIKMFSLTVPFVSLRIGVRFGPAGVITPETRIPEADNITSVRRIGDRGMTIGFASNRAASNFEQAVTTLSSADYIPEFDSIVFVGISNRQVITIVFASALAAREFENAIHAESPFAEII